MQRLKDEQNLSHLIRSQDYVDAAILAFKLNKTRDFVHVMNKLLSKQDESLDQVDSVIQDFNNFKTVENNNFSVSSVDKLGSKSDWLDEIVTKLMEVNPQKLLCLL